MLCKYTVYHFPLRTFDAFSSNRRVQQLMFVGRRRFLFQKNLLMILVKHGHGHLSVVELESIFLHANRLSSSHILYKYHVFLLKTVQISRKFLRNIFTFSRLFVDVFHARNYLHISRPLLTNVYN